MKENADEKELSNAGKLDNTELGQEIRKLNPALLKELSPSEREQLATEVIKRGQHFATFLTSLLIVAGLISALSGHSDVAKTIFGFTIVP